MCGIERFCIHHVAICECKLTETSSRCALVQRHRVCCSDGSSNQIHSWTELKHDHWIALLHSLRLITSKQISARVLVAMGNPCAARRIDMWAQRIDTPLHESSKICSQCFSLYEHQEGSVYMQPDKTLSLPTAHPFV